MNKDINQVATLLQYGVELSEIFTEVDDFVDGIARVRIDKQWNYLTEKGTLLSEKLWFNAASAFDEQGLAVVKIGRREYRIDRKGYMYLYIVYNTFDVDSKLEGFHKVRLRDKENFIDNEGHLLLDHWADRLEVFNPSTLAVWQDDKANFIDLKGMPLYAEWFSDIRPSTASAGGCWQVEKNGEFNFVDDKGELISKEWFDDVYLFHEKFVEVELGGKHNLMDSSCRWLLDKWMDSVEIYTDFAIIGLDGKYCIIDESGKNITNLWFDEVTCCGDSYKPSFVIARKDRKFYIIHSSGKTIDVDVDEMEFSENAYKGEEWVLVKKNNKYNFVGYDGDFLFRQWRDERYQFVVSSCAANGLFIVRKDNDYHKENFADENGSLVLSQWYFELKIEGDIITSDDPYKKSYNYTYRENCFRRDGTPIFDEPIAIRDQIDAPDSILNGFIVERKGGECNLMDYKGNLFFKQWVDGLSYDSHYDFLTICQRNKWNFIDIHGKLVNEQWLDSLGEKVPCIISYNAARSYVSVRCLKGTLDGEEMCVRPDGTIRSLKDPSNLDVIIEYAKKKQLNGEIEFLGKKNYLTKDGKLLSDTWYEELHEYETYFYVALDGRANLLDGSGKPLFKQWYEKIYIDYGLDHGLNIVRLHSKENLIDLKGRYLLPQWYDGITACSENGPFIVEQKQKYNVINKNGKYVCPQWFDEVVCLDSSIGFVVSLDGKSKFFSTHGKEMTKWYKPSAEIDRCSCKRSNGWIIVVTYARYAKTFVFDDTKEEPFITKVRLDSDSLQFLIDNDRAKELVMWETYAR